MNGKLGVSVLSFMSFYDIIELFIWLVFCYGVTHFICKSLRFGYYLKGHPMKLSINKSKCDADGIPYSIDAIECSAEETFRWKIDLGLLISSELGVKFGAECLVAHLLMPVLGVDTNLFLQIAVLHIFIGMVSFLLISAGAPFMGLEEWFLRGVIVIASFILCRFGVVHFLQAGNDYVSFLHGFCLEAKLAAPIWVALSCFVTAAVLWVIEQVRGYFFIQKVRAKMMQH